MKLFLFILCSIFLMAACQTKDTGSLKKLISDYHHKGAFNGSILVAQKGKIILVTAMGYKDLATKSPIGSNTSFYIASLAKPFTALAIMQLNEQHKLNLQDSISKYIPGLPRFAIAVTIQQLLTHTSGIPDYENDISDPKNLTNQQVLQWLRSKPGLNFKSGDKFEYSNTGYILLSMIIEKTSGTSYAQYMQANIFIPAGMQHTIVFEPATVIADRAIGYDQKGEKDDYSLLTTGDGGIFSTTGDLYRWVQQLDNGKLVNNAALQAAYHSTTLNNGSISNYGFGWNIEGSPEARILSHTGGLDGYRAMIWRDLKNETVIIVLTNHGDAFPLQQFMNEVIERLPNVISGLNTQKMNG